MRRGAPVAAKKTAVMTQPPSKAVGAMSNRNVVDASLKLEMNDTYDGSEELQGHCSNVGQELDEFENRLANGNRPAQQKAPAQRTRPVVAVPVDRQQRQPMAEQPRRVTNAQRKPTKRLTEEEEEHHQDVSDVQKLPDY